MRYRTLTDLPRPAEANFDAVEIEAAAARALRETHLAMLARMAQVGMALIEAIAPGAQTDSAQACAAGQAYAKVSQAVRRTMALQIKLAREAEPDAAARRATCEARCDDHVEAFREAKTQQIMGAVEGAWAAECSEEETARDLSEVDRLLYDAEQDLGLEDGDDLDGYLDRPVGETVAKLCAALGLDADACRLEDGEWRVRRPPSPFERGCEAFKRRRAAPAVDPMADPPPAREPYAPP